MKQELNTETIVYRRRYGWTLLCLSLSLILLATFTRTSVSARQSTPAPAADAHPEFPAGTGKATVLRLCSKCHSPNIILANGQDRTGWENTITKMVGLGAQGDDDDFSDIADYLTANFPPSTVKKVFINMATEKQIADVLGVSEDDAKAIVAYRDKINGFKTIDDLKQVPGVDTKKIDANKDRLIFGATTVKPAAN